MRKAPRCAAVCERSWRNQIPLARLCQNSAVSAVDGVWLCGTHINAIARGPIEVTVEIEMSQ